jgi:hypothetical protein
MILNIRRRSEEMTLAMVRVPQRREDGEGMALVTFAGTRALRITHLMTRTKWRRSIFSSTKFLFAGNRI